MTTSNDENNPHRWDVDEAAAADFRQRLEAARQEVFDHPATRLVAQMTTLRRSIEAVVIANFHELAGLLRAPSSDQDLAIKLVQNVRQSVVAEQYSDRLVQRLHNYLAGTYTLVEHVRALMADQPEPLVTEWSEERRKRFATGAVAFVGDLRRYIQHYAHLPLSHHLRMSGPAATSQFSEFTIELDVNELRRWTDWLAPARQFLEEEETVPLLPLVEKHVRTVVAANRWLLGRLAAQIPPLAEEYNDLVVKANAVLTGLDLDAARLLTEQRTSERYSPDSPPGFS